MINIVKLYTVIVLGVLYFVKADCSEFQEFYPDDFFFVNDSDKVCTVDISGLKNARFFKTKYEGEITVPTLAVHPGKYQYGYLRYISSNLELGHVLFYAANIAEYEASLKTNENNKELEQWLMGSLDFVIPKNRDSWCIFFNNDSLARFSVNEKLGLVLYRQLSSNCIVIRLMNMLPEYRYTNRRTASEYICSFTGKEYPEEEPEDGDTKPLYVEPSLDWQDVVRKYKPEEEEKEKGCCTVQ